MYTYVLTSEGIPLRYNVNTVSQSEYEKGEYTDYDTVAVTETVEVDDSVYRTNEKGEKELVLERTKTIEKPVMEVIEEAKTISKGLDENGIEIFEEIPAVLKPVTKLVPVTRNINTGIAVIPDDAKVITEEEYQKKLEEMKPQI